MQRADRGTAVYIHSLAAYSHRDMSLDYFLPSALSQCYYISSLLAHPGFYTVCLLSASGVSSTCSDVFVSNSGSSLLALSDPLIKCNVWS